MLSKSCYCRLQFRLLLEHYAYAVGYLETRILTQSLYALDDESSHALVLEFFGYLYVKGYCYGAFLCYGPAWYVFRDYLYVNSLDCYFLTCGRESDRAVFLQFGYLLLRHRGYGIVDILHQFAKLLAHSAEVTFYLLDELHARPFLDEGELLDVGLSQYHARHTLYAIAESIVACWYRDSLQSLYYWYLYLLAE